MLLLTKLLSVKPRNLLLVDTIGAAISALVMGLIFVPSAGILGVNRWYLVLLALMPVGFIVVNGLTLLARLWPYSQALLIIAILNSVYLLVSGSVWYTHSESVSIYMSAYFAAELLVLLTLTAIEFSVFILNKS